MDSLIKLNTRNEVLVADRVVGRLESPFVIDSTNLGRLTYGLEQDYSGDSLVLHKKVRDHMTGLRHQIFGGGLRRHEEGSIISARTHQTRSHFRGFHLTNDYGGMGVAPRRNGYVGAPGGKLMRVEDWSPNLFGFNSQLFLAGLMATRRMAKRFDYTAMGMVRL